jgi:hypothetical protein
MHELVTVICNFIFIFSSFNKNDASLMSVAKSRDFGFGYDDCIFRFIKIQLKVCENIILS